MLHHGPTRDVLYDELIRLVERGWLELHYGPRVHLPMREMDALRATGWVEPEDLLDDEVMEKDAAIRVQRVARERGSYLAAHFAQGPLQQRGMRFSHADRFRISGIGPWEPPPWKKLPRGFALHIDSQVEIGTRSGEVYRGGLLAVEGPIRSRQSPLFAAGSWVSQKAADARNAAADIPELSEVIRRGSSVPPAVTATSPRAAGS
jgi:hypothetical protein